MANQRFNAMISQHCSSFRQHFSEVADKLFERQRDDPRPGPLIHSSEYGSYREVIAKNFLLPFTPSCLGIGSGFLMDSHGRESGQCDVIVFDKSLAPFSDSPDFGLFYPVESVVCIGEIKSNLTRKQDFVDALRQIEALSHFVAQQSSLESHSFPLSFVICKMVSSDTKQTRGDIHRTIAEWYLDAIAEDVCHMCPNLLLSLEGGLLETDGGECVDTSASFTSPGIGSTTHIKKFVSRYFRHVVQPVNRELSIIDYCQTSQEDLVFPVRT